MRAAYLDEREALASMLAKEEGVVRIRFFMGGLDAIIVPQTTS